MDLQAWRERKQPKSQLTHKFAGILNHRSVVDAVLFELAYRDDKRLVSHVRFTLIVLFGKLLITEELEFVSFGRRNRVPKLKTIALCS